MLGLFSPEKQTHAKTSLETYLDKKGQPWPIEKLFRPIMSTYLNKYKTIIIIIIIILSCIIKINYKFVNLSNLNLLVYINFLYIYMHYYKLKSFG